MPSTRLLLPAILGLLLTIAVTETHADEKKALVGGRLIDGLLGDPIANIR